MEVEPTLICRLPTGTGACSWHWCTTTVCSCAEALDSGRRDPRCRKRVVIGYWLRVFHPLDCVSSLNRSHLYLPFILPSPPGPQCKLETSWRPSIRSWFAVSTALLRYSGRYSTCRLASACQPRRSVSRVESLPGRKEGRCREALGLGSTDPPIDEVFIFFCS